MRSPSKEALNFQILFYISKHFREQANRLESTQTDQRTSKQVREQANLLEQELFYENNPQLHLGKPFRYFCDDPVQQTTLFISFLPNHNDKTLVYTFGGECKHSSMYTLYSFHSRISDLFIRFQSTIYLDGFSLKQLTKQATGLK